MTAPCIIWTGATSSNGRYGPHRRVFKETYGYLPPVVRHTCDVTRCIEPTHLVGGTHADNMRDMVERGRSVPLPGERNGRAKLSAVQVTEIRQRLADGEGVKPLARAYGVMPSTIRRARDGISWRST